MPTALFAVLLSVAAGTSRDASPRCEVKLPARQDLARLPRATRNVPAPAAAGGGFQIVLNAGPTLLANAPALAAWQLAVGDLEAVISDSVTVVIDADLASLPPNVLGSAGSTQYLLPFDDARAAMISDGGPDESALLGALPTLAQFSSDLPPGFSPDTDMLMTSANCRALGLGCTPSADATITFSTDFPFDYDPSDGITSGEYDFVAIATHEMIHALGFVSVVDVVDQNIGSPFAVPPATLDLLRLAPGVGSTDFTSGTRLLGPGDFTPTHACYDGAVDLRYSEGRFNGDGRQASHWRDDALSPFFRFGIMDPNIAPGVRRTMSANDLRILDLIGWDIASVAASDCNANGFSDAQDLAVGGSRDCNGDAIPDECQPGVACFIGGVCYLDGDPNPGDSCSSCDALADPVGWTVRPNGFPCADGVFCNGAETCESGLCTPGSPPCGSDCDLCDEAGGTCTHCRFDLDGDPVGVIGTGDFGFFSPCFGRSFLPGDADYDGCLPSNFDGLIDAQTGEYIVGTSDFSLLSNCFELTCSQCSTCFP
jgi:hypothetical protein